MICVIGMGPGNVKYLTQEAIETIQHADQVIAFGRIAETAQHIKKPVIRVKRVEDVLGYLTPDQKIAILASGDPCFYGILEYLKKKNITITQIVPGLSSFQYLMAKLQKSWHQANFMSLHGREEELEQIKTQKLTVILTDKLHTPHYISKRLQEIGITGKIYIGYNLSYEDECIIEKQIGEDIEECREISVVVVERL